MNAPTTTDFVEGLAYAMETLAFVCLGPADDRTVPALPVHCTMTCGGRGPAMRLHMIAPISLGHVVAANMLGTEPTDPHAADRALDSLREIMNVSCGALCARAAADAPTEAIELGLPESAALDAADAPARWESALARPDTQILDADGHVIAVWLETAA
jgi:hypothetical protein